MGTFIAVLFVIVTGAWLLWLAGNDVAKAFDPTWAPQGHTPSDICSCTTCAMSWQEPAIYTHTYTNYPHTDTHTEGMR